MKFKVDDLIVAIEGSSYAITKEGVVCKVIDINIVDEMICVEIYEGKNKHERFYVYERDFCKIENIPTINVFIKKLRKSIGKVFGSKEEYGKLLRHICPSCKLFYHTHRILKLKVTYGEVKYEFKIKYDYTDSFNCEIFIESIIIDGESIWKDELKCLK